MTPIEKGLIATAVVFIIGIIISFISNRCTKNYSSFRKGSIFVASAKTREEINNVD